MHILGLFIYIGLNFKNWDKVGATTETGSTLTRMDSESKDWAIGEIG